MDPRIDNLLTRLRRQIRGYVWLEGLAWAIGWLCLTFWVGLAVDYLPVMLGASEMPVEARAVLLTLILLALAWILYDRVIRRIVVRLPARNLAVLVERSFPQLADALVTAVELDDERSVPPQYGREMLRSTKQYASERVAEVRLQSVFDYGPLLRVSAAAAVLALSLVVFGALATDAFALCMQRLYGLSTITYPRRTLIELLGFADGQLTVARGANVTIRVRADATRPLPPPDVCTIRFETEEGDRGRVNMSRMGEPRDGFQHYVYEGKPFKGILSNVRFDVVAHDHRVRDQRIRVVASPQIVGIDLEYQLPPYTGLLPRRDSYYNGIQLPQGSRLTLRATTNKPLVRVAILDPANDQVTTLDSGHGVLEEGNGFVYKINPLEGTTVREVTLVDTNGITSDQPYRISIQALVDRPPVVTTRLRGIGTAVTPDARLPIGGEISDDYGIDRSWIALQLPDGPERTYPVVLDEDNTIDSVLDLRQLRHNDTDPLPIAVETKISLCVKSADKYDLEAEPHIGEGERYELDVVTPNRLLAILEAQELGLRRRFEQIVSETRETRDSLARVQIDQPRPPAPAPPSNPAPTEDAERQKEADQQTGLPLAELNLLRTQQAVQHSQRAAQEVLGVALSFDDICDELVNNRIDSAERTQRILRDVSGPLKQISNDLFPALTTRLQWLEAAIDDPVEGSAMARSSLRQIDKILITMERILESMLDLESYNELIDLVRSLVREQEVLLDQTKKHQKQKALELLR
jgi:hypothetical protein